MVVVGEHAAEQHFNARAGENWSMPIELEDDDGNPWVWTGKTAKMQLRRAAGAPVVVDLSSSSGLDITVLGEITILIDFSSVAGQWLRYDLWETLTAGDIDRPLLWGWFNVFPSMTAT